MRRSKDSKSVSWPSVLSQVKLFSSEDAPSQVGSSGTQDLKGKVSWQAQQSGVGSQGIHQPSNLWRFNVSRIPLINWKSPSMFMVNSNWLVAAGEESSEIDAQKQRELRVVEAIYPRPSAIPPNPTLLVHDSIPNDQNTPIVRITPIEDDDPVPGSSMPAETTPVESSSSASTITPDIAAAVRAAFAMTNCSPSQIDCEFLVKILTNPTIVELLLLVNNHTGTSSIPAMHTVPPALGPSMTMSSPVVITSTVCSASALALSFYPQSTARPVVNVRPPVLASTQFNTSHVGIISRNSFDPINVPRPKPIYTVSATGPSSYPLSRVRPVVNVRPPVPDIITLPSPPLPIAVKKDVHYYKSLVQQHGVDRRDSLLKSVVQSNQQSGTGQELSNLKPKKSCIYFNTSRGCWNGPNCLFQHSGQRVSGISDVPSAKRVKLDRQFTGTR